MNAIIIIFILACAVTNCLGGRFPKDENTAIRPELIFRGAAVGAMSGLYASTLGYPAFVAVFIGAWVALTNGLWATFAWGIGFMSVTGRDSRNSSVMCRLTNRITGYDAAQILTPSQCKWYGFVYMTIRGLYQYPLFIGLAIAFLNPWILVIGLGCMLQGACYRVVRFFKENVASVACAELLEGALYGTLIALAI